MFVHQSPAEVAVVRMFLDHPARPFTVPEIVERSGFASTSVRTQLERLERARVIYVSSRGRRYYYRLRREPNLKYLADLMVLSIDLGAPLREVEVIDTLRGDG